MDGVNMAHRKQNLLGSGRSGVKEYEDGEKGTEKQ